MSFVVIPAPAAAEAEAPRTECAEKILTSIPFNTSRSHLAIVQEVNGW